MNMTTRHWAWAPHWVESSSFSTLLWLLDVCELSRWSTCVSAFAYTCPCDWGAVILSIGCLQDDFIYGCVKLCKLKVPDRMIRAPVSDLWLTYMYSLDIYVLSSLSCRVSECITRASSTGYFVLLSINVVNLLSIWIINQLFIYNIMYFVY